MINVEIESKDDIHLIISALSMYYEKVHPDNSCKKDVAKLIKLFARLR